MESVYLVIPIAGGGVTVVFLCISCIVVTLWQLRHFKPSAACLYPNQSVLAMASTAPG
jgi:hypothetical protein